VNALAALKQRALAALPPCWAGRLRALRIAWMVRRFRRYVVVHRYGGHTLRVLIADPLARGWYDHDGSELPEIRALRGRRLVAGATVFDIGAHQGVVALQLAREVSPGGRVVAVEPSAHNVAVARENARLNGAPVTVVEAAVTETDGAVAFSAGLNGQLDDGSGAAGRVRVAGRSIDSLAAEFGAPDVVYLDVEGAEHLALRGAPATLASGCAFVVEVHQGCGLEKLGGSADQVLAHFPAARFHRSYCFEGDAGFRPLPADGAAVPAGRFFLLAEPASLQRPAP
jgi:FkbM family methyltransferase